MREAKLSTVNFSSGFVVSFCVFPVLVLVSTVSTYYFLQYYSTAVQYLSTYLSIPRTRTRTRTTVIQTQMTQEPNLRAEVYARALPVRQNRK